MGMKIRHIVEERCGKADSFAFANGLVTLRDGEGVEICIRGRDVVPDLDEFIEDYKDVSEIVCDTPKVKTTACKLLAIYL